MTRGLAGLVKVDPPEQAAIGLPQYTVWFARESLCACSSCSPIGSLLYS